MRYGTGIALVTGLIVGITLLHQNCSQVGQPSRGNGNGYGGMKGDPSPGAGNSTDSGSLASREPPRVYVVEIEPVCADGSPVQSEIEVYPEAAYLSRNGCSKLATPVLVNVQIDPSENFLTFNGQIYRAK